MCVFVLVYECVCMCVHGYVCVCKFMYVYAFIFIYLLWLKYMFSLQNKGTLNMGISFKKTLRNQTY